MVETARNLSERLPGGSLRGAIEFLERLHWYLNIRESVGRISLFRGETPLFSADSKDAVEGFVYGAFMAYSSSPKALFKQYQEQMDSLKGSHASIPGLDPL